ncbi:class I adenylate-forming enzyme family protein [Desulfosarcina cetonica]|uniref:class I adenylate-forming enzyme family protein n=1 Tax=Desulfosarcina cetonica TaxID=90730 RepID=UPI0030EDEE81
MPTQTSRTIVDGGLHTGDLGYMDKDGFVYLVDRAKDMYRSGAENVYPAEVEAVLSDHPDIAAVAIIGVPDERWGETGKAFVQCRAGTTVTLTDVHAFLSGRVARYKFPSLLEIIDEMPVTVWGKLKKSELKKMHVNRQTDALSISCALRIRQH